MTTSVPVRKKHLRILTHILFWVTVLGFYTYFYGHTYDDYYSTFLFVCLLLPITIATTYFLNYYLIPKYLLKKKYGYFVLYAVYSLIFSAYFELIIIFLAYIIFADFNINKMNPLTKDLFFLMVGLYFVVFFAVAVKMLKNWYQIQRNNQQLNEEKLEAELKLKEMQLELLKGQIQPHFLFNTLNNLYGLTLSKSDNAPNVVLLISDLLDYLLYRCNASEVGLQNEIDHLSNYLALQKIRYGANIRITFEVSGPITNQKIAPSLLLPFVENSFKHGVSNEVNDGFITIKLRISGNNFYFNVENSKTNLDSASTSRLSRGIGLANVKKRLGLIYPGQHRLIIENSENTYKASLYLGLHKTAGELSAKKEPSALISGKGGLS
ncbi:histidine kinase [Fulvivirgaceae bacterium BMA12]|uniref:Histidine kinase n=1 Tax=Agaribacillus aureus TaxID=3051825 RepID=A0ABT8L9D9_9BACT|nr:histidine kinase [Fulvivirgaceae bacterium BMA12]